MINVSGEIVTILVSDPNAVLKVTVVFIAEFRLQEREVSGLSIEQMGPRPLH